MGDWEQPELPFGEELPPSDRFKLNNFVGCAVLVAVGGCHPAIQTRYDPAPAVRVSIVILNGPDEGDEYADCLIFNSQPVRTLRPAAGKAFVAHVDIDNSGNNPAPVLLNPSPEEYELARKWHEANPDRCNELIREAVTAFEVNEAKLAAPMPTQRQQQQRSAPPTGPGYGRSAPPASARTEPGPPPPPAPLPKDSDEEPPF